MFVFYSILRFVIIRNKVKTYTASPTAQLKHENEKGRQIIID